MVNNDLLKNQIFTHIFQKIQKFKVILNESEKKHTDNRRPPPV